MASTLQGIFEADFTSFVNACASADVALTSFQTNAGKVEGAVNRMADSLSGQKIVQQAMIASTAIEQIGGVTKLTNDELLRMGTIAQQAVDKLTLAGQQVPPQIQNIADRARGAAEEMLRLKDGSEETGNALSKWGSGIDIQSVLTDPIGVAKGGMIAFAETLGPTGVALTGIATVGAIVGGEFISLGNAAEAVGAEIGKMSRQFNIPVEAMSDLRFAITATGNDFGAFGDSMFMFQKRIEENGAQVSKGLDAIGLSFETIKGLQGDQQILAISDAMRAAGSNTNLAAVSFDLFGRQGREMLPLLLKPLSDLTDKSRELGATWSGEDVAAAKEFRGEMNLLKAESEEAWTGLGRAVAPLTNDLNLIWESTKLGAAQLATMAVEAVPKLGDALASLAGYTGEEQLKTESAMAAHDAAATMFDRQALSGHELEEATINVAKEMLNLGYNQTTVARETGLATDKIRELSAELKNAKTASEQYNAAWDRVAEAEAKGVTSIADLDTATRGYVTHLQELHVKAQDIATITGVNVEQQKLLTTAHAEGEAAAKKYADAWVELNSTGKNYADTVAGLNPKIVEQAEYYLKAGNSIATVAAAFPTLSAAQAKALDEMVKSYEATYKQIQKIEGDHVKQQETNIFGLSKAENDSTQLGLTNLGKASTEIMAINARLTDDYNKQTMTRSAYEEQKLWESADAQIKAFQKTGVTAQQVTEFTNRVYEETALKAAAIYTSAKSTLDNLTQAGIDDMNRLIAAEQQAADLAARTAADVAAKADAAANAWKKTTYSMGPSGDLAAAAAKIPGASVAQDYYGNDYVYVPGKNAPPTSARAPGAYATGVTDFTGGLAIVGEKGPELVNLPGGAIFSPRGRSGVGAPRSRFT